MSFTEIACVIKHTMPVYTLFNVGIATQPYFMFVH